MLPLAGEVVMEGVKLEVSSRSDLVNAVGMRITQDFERVVCRHYVLTQGTVIHNMTVYALYQSSRCIHQVKVVTRLLIDM